VDRNLLGQGSEATQPADSVPLTFFRVVQFIRSQQESRNTLDSSVLPLPPSEEVEQLYHLSQSMQFPD